MRAFFTIPFALFLAASTLAQIPVNDDCSGIIDLGEVPYCSQVAQYTNVNATTSNVDASANIPSCWNNLAERDVWFQFSLPADGSILDITVDVWGNIAGNGTMEMPQVAVYRGDCIFNGLAELACLAAPLNIDEVHLELFGLTPGVPYFIRINDYSPTASPNAGTFKLCINKYVPDINIGESQGSSSCSGTLWDSGGPAGDYQSDENLTFEICPSDFHQCIKLDFQSYDVEDAFDYIRVFEGSGTSGALLLTLTGTGSNFTFQTPADCVTIQFDSDNSIEQEGFKMTWLCSPEICDAQPPVLPSNATCETALNLNGCDNVPTIMPLSPGQGDPGFIQDGINAGCFTNPSVDFNFSFFYFQAQVDGKFGFAVQSANPNEATDIDFNVWGPINNFNDICDFAANNQPVRSSWDEGPDLTGLADIHPVLGLPVLDNFDCGSPATPGTDPPIGQADDFVRRLDVQAGKYYLILLDDFEGNIQQDGMAIDFSGTTEGVFGPVSTPISVSNDTSSCNGSAVQLAVTGGVDYAWTPSAGLSCNDCPNPFASPTVTTAYQVTVIDVCQTYIDTVVVSIGPIISLTNDTTLCNGQSVVLGNTVPEPATTYTWTPNDGSLSNPNEPNPTATPTQTTVYTLTAKSGSCETVRSVTVAVINLDFSVSVSDTSICKGNSVPISVTVSPSNANLNWSPLNQIQVQPNGLSALASPTVSRIYTVTASLPGCVRKELINIQVDSLPANLHISPADTTICAGQQVLLVSPSYSGANYPNIEFTWQTGTGQTLPDDEYFLLAKPDVTTLYQRISRNGACSDTAAALITVAPVPTLIITPSQPQLCLGETVNLQVSNTGGLLNPSWLPAIGLSCIACNNPTAAPSSSALYTYTAGVPNGCTATASVFVEVNQTPVFQLANDTLCFGESILLNAVTDTTVTYSWTSFPAGFVSSEAQPVDTPAQTTTYLLNMENGCTVNQQFTIQVVPPGNLQVSAKDTICLGASAVLTASGNYPGQFQWSTGANGQVTTVAPTTTTTYTVQYNYPNPSLLCQATDSVTITVQGEVAQVQFPADTLLCSGEGVVLNTIATPEATYSWTSSPSGFTSSEATPALFFPTESATYQVSTELNGCSYIYEVDITVYNPEMVVSDDTIICAGQPLTIFADAFLTGTYEWIPGGTDPTFTVNLENNARYDLMFMYGDGCIYEDSVLVTVLPGFDIKLISDPDTSAVNAGSPVMLDAFIPGTNVSNFTFEWQEGVDVIGNTQQITVTPVTIGDSITYVVTVVSQNGCVETASITFAVLEPEVQFPNAFTPNGDGANDGFGLVIAEGIAVVEQMDVYNRWGQKVFSSAEPDARWDGTVEGKPAPSDVYVYVIFWRGGDGALRFNQGEVTLLR
ncbi:MAG: gliding motility-associated C-terminal domain-containing protein [Chitinophagales bacterium]|nr:gliding motility-associated C-terminal domain-containing protein [Chitinophagales bacterium]